MNTGPNDEALEKEMLTIFGPVHPTRPGEHTLVKNNTMSWTCAVCGSEWKFDSSYSLEERLQEIRDARDEMKPGGPNRWGKDVWENWVKCPTKMR